MRKQAFQIIFKIFSQICLLAVLFLVIVQGCISGDQPEIKILEKIDGKWRLSYIGFYYLPE